MLHIVPAHDEERVIGTYAVADKSNYETVRMAFEAKRA